MYIAISLPVIGEGIAADALGLQTAGIVFSIAVAVLAAAALATVIPARHASTRPGTPLRHGL
jgi:hypothetical protein